MRRASRLGVALGALAGLSACGAGSPADDEDVDGALPRCGDGIRHEELGEFCDQGELNGTEDATCTTECWEPRMVFDAPPFRFQLAHAVDESIYGHAYMPVGRQELRRLDSPPATTLLAPVSAPPTSFAAQPQSQVFWLEQTAEGSRLYCRSGSDTEPRELLYPFADGTRGELVQVAGDEGLAILVDHSAGAPTELLAALVRINCHQPDIGPITRLGAAPAASATTIMARDVWTPMLGQHVHVVAIYDAPGHFVAFEGGVLGTDVEFPFERVAEGAWTAEIVDWSSWEPHLVAGEPLGVEAPLAMLTPDGEVLLWRFRDGTPSEESSPHFGWVAPGTQAITAPLGWDSILALEPDGTLAILFNGSTSWPLTALRRQEYALSPPYSVASSDVASRWIVTADGRMFMLPFAALPNTPAVHIDGIPD